MIVAIVRTSECRVSILGKEAAFKDVELFGEEKNQQGPFEDTQEDRASIL